MRRLLYAALLVAGALALAVSVRAEELVIGGLGSVKPDWLGYLNTSPECLAEGADYTTSPPPLAETDATIACVSGHLRTEIAAGRLTPGGGYVWPQSDVERALTRFLWVAWYATKIRAGMICARSVGTYPVMQVSILNAYREGGPQRRVAWEAANARLGFLLRPDLYDDVTVVGGAMDRCAPYR